GSKYSRMSELDDRIDSGLANRLAANKPLRRQQDIAVNRRFGARHLRAGCIEKNFALSLLIGIVDVDLHQESIELRLGQWISALLFEWILRRQHMERLGQIVAGSSDGHVLLLHGLQKGRLGTRRRTIDFVGHRQLCGDWSGEEAEA